MNSEVIEELEEEQEESLDTGPGQLLNNKREALGLSVQEVADKLHITMHYVRALETDAHDKLPGDVFIKGYLRAYSSLLGLEPGIVINVYNEYTNQRESAEMASDTRRRRQRNKNMPWVIVSGIAFVVIAIVLWFFSTTSVETAQPAPAASRPSATRSVSTADTTLANVATTREVPSTPNTSAAVPAAEVAEVEEVEEVEEVAVVNEDTDASVVDNEAFAVEASDPGAEQSDVLLDESDAMSDEPAQTLEPEPQPLTPERLISIEGDGEDTVQIRFTGESMVQVDDANDVQLYRDVRVAGDVLRINGTAPFNVLLGDASNSELSLNGAEIDFRASIRIDNSARLTIGL